MKRIIEFDEKCKSCNGTGLYIGLAERDGAAVVCHTCHGTGCHHFKHEYEDFEGRDSNIMVKHVLQVNPGIVVGEGNGKYNLFDFGGMTYEDWLSGKEFVPGMEMRQFTCPAWWYQIADYTRKPRWNECIVCGSFSSCKHFSKKSECWKRWDQEQEADHDGE